MKTDLVVIGTTKEVTMNSLLKLKDSDIQPMWDSMIETTRNNCQKTLAWMESEGTDRAGKINILASMLTVLKQNHKL